jgi:hypothetical protein
MNAKTQNLLTHVLVGIFLLLGLAANGQDSLRAELSPFLKNHCFDCHSGDSPESGLDLSSNSVAMDDAEVRRRWVDLHDRVASGEMPPESAERPDAKTRVTFLRQLGVHLKRADLANREVVLRRLNRSEYTNSVEDLFDIEVDLERLLPSDSSEQGFDTTGSALSLSAEQMVLYVEAADLVLDRLLGPTQKPKTIEKTVNFTQLSRGFGDSERTLDDGIVLFSGAKFLPLYGASLPTQGLYRVRVKIRAEQSETPVVMHVLGGNTGAIAAHTVGFFEAMPGKVTTVEFTDRNPERSDCFAFGLVGGYPWWKVNESEYQGAGLFIGDIEIEGPIEQWPPASRIKLLAGVDPSHGTIEDVRRIISRQLPVAWRRATTEDETEPYVALAQQALDEGLSFEKALRRALKGVICAPEFLFLEERLANRLKQKDSVNQNNSTKRIDDYALASRLSYFLWSSLPDRELLSLAFRSDLSDNDQLRSQVERMLADPKSQRFVERFTGQWLRLNDIDFTVPDRNLYPEYDQLLRQSMLNESHAFFREILDRDHSVHHFIDSDFVMINQPLAEFYGIEDVRGLDIRRVKLPADSLRGGVLTQASILKVSADGTRTSPVLRGAWILKHLYGTPSPPPPPSVEAIEPDIRGATTIREQLAKHREHESCNRCHHKIDPPGFALEQFDVIGAERDWYRTRGSGKYVKVPRHPQAPNHFVQYRQGSNVDASGTTPNGEKFVNIRDYKLLILQDELGMPRALAQMLLTYSLGRPMGYADRIEIERIVTAVQKNDYGLRALIHEIVQSELFATP